LIEYVLFTPLDGSIHSRRRRHKCASTSITGCCWNCPCVWRLLPTSTVCVLTCLVPYTLVSKSRQRIQCDPGYSVPELRLWGGLCTASRLGKFSISHLALVICSARSELVMGIRNS